MGVFGWISPVRQEGKSWEQAKLTECLRVRARQDRDS